MDELIKSARPQAFTDIENYIAKADWQIKENANSDISYSGLQAYMTKKAIKEYALTHYSEMVKTSYQDGYFHIHNLSDGIVPYCFGADLFKLLKMGLITTRIRSKPAKHLNTAVDHMVNYLATSQQEWAGAQALSNVNWLLAPFVYHDNLSYKQVKQEMQRLVFNLNYPSRAGYQTPFTNLIFDSKCPSKLRELPVLGNGNTYQDFPDESEMILRAFNEVLYEGDGIGSVFTFPIPTLNLIKSTDFDSELFYEIMKTDAKFGSWYFMNYIGTGIDEDSVQAMCCRLSLDLSELPPAGGRWALSGNTGSIGVVTINLARLGYISRSEDELYDNMDMVLSLAKSALLAKGDIIQRSFNNGLMPLAKIYEVDLNRFFRTVGIVGLNEMLLNFNGDNILQSPDLALSVLHYIRDWTKRTQLETGLLWNFEMTPAEGCATDLAMKDRVKYPDIITMGDSQAPYYTSMITPPSYEMGMNKRLTFEEPMLNSFTGGTVHRLYIGEADPSPESLTRLTERIANTKVPYFDFSATFSVCPHCSTYERGIHYDCSSCGGASEVFSRVVGYYRSTNKYNKGKVREFSDRTYLNIVA